MSQGKWVSDAVFIETYNRLQGSLKDIARELGLADGGQTVDRRRRRIEQKLGINLLSPSPKSSRNVAKLKQLAANGRIELAHEGCILVGSDAHLWPGERTTAQRGFLKLISEIRPAAVVMNGDIFDGAKISRFPAGIWAQEQRPSVKQELDACQSYLSAVVDAAKGAKLIWLYGNHDARFEMRLAAMNPEYEGVPGFALKDHFPEWKFGMSLFVNEDLVIKHRYHNGIHAVYNNAVKGGRSIATGHLHSLKVTPWTDYNGTRYGIDTGTLAEFDGPQFDYAEDNPRNHRSGFAVLTCHKGKLLLPELAQVEDGALQFRGQVLEV